MRMLVLIFFVVCVFSDARAQQPWTYGAGSADNLENVIKYKNGIRNIAGSLNPSVTAVNAPAGSLYFSTSGVLYVKQDAGLSTNWSALSAGSSGITSINSLLGPAISIVTGTAGTDFNITSSSNTVTLQLPSASASNRGALTAADWTTFNGKQPSGNYITATTGDVVSTGPGSVAATIQPLAVTGAKIANGTIDLTTKVQGILPVPNGGTGRSSHTVGQLLLGNGASAMTQLSSPGNYRALVSPSLNGNPLYVYKSEIQDALSNQAGNYTITTGNLGVYRIDASGGVSTVTLPPGAASLNKRVTIQKSDVSANAVNIVPDGSDTINGAASLSLGFTRDIVTLFNNGTDWVIESRISNAPSASTDFQLATSTVTTNTAAAVQSYYRANATGGAFNVTLPSAVGIAGKILRVRKTDASANVVTIVGTINGATNFLLEFQDDEVEVISNGTDWDVN